MPRSKKVTWYGIKFDSIVEGERYLQLRSAQQLDEISELECHPKFTLQEAFTTREGKRIRAITYTADFMYKTHDGYTIVEDVKGVDRRGKPRITPASALRIKLFQYLYRRYHFRIVGM